MADLHAVAEGLHIALFVAGVLSLLLRFYSRAIVIRKWGHDDTIAVATLVRALVVNNVLMLTTIVGSLCRFASNASACVRRRLWIVRIDIEKFSLRGDLLIHMCRKSLNKCNPVTNPDLPKVQHILFPSKQRLY